jgi:hypothetical protein
MKFGLSESRALRFLGYVIFVAAILNIIQDVFHYWRLGHIELSIGMADTAFMLVGVVAISAAAGLMKLERRLDRLERPPGHGDQR